MLVFMLVLLVVIFGMLKDIEFKLAFRIEELEQFVRQTKQEQKQKLDQIDHATYNGAITAHELKNEIVKIKSRLDI